MSLAMFIKKLEFQEKMGLEWTKVELQMITYHVFFLN